MKKRMQTRIKLCDDEPPSKKRCGEDIVRTLLDSPTSSYWGCDSPMINIKLQNKYEINKECEDKSECEEEGKEEGEEREDSEKSESRGNIPYKSFFVTEQQNIDIGNNLLMQWKVHRDTSFYFDMDLMRRVRGCVCCNSSQRCSVPSCICCTRYRFFT